MRNRAAQGGLAALPDYELLELILFRSIPRKDTKPLAKALLREFGSFEALSTSSVERLQNAVKQHMGWRAADAGSAVAVDLLSVFEVARRIAREPTRKREVISSWTALLAYVRVHLQHQGAEQFRVLYLDRKNQLILDEETGRGTVDHAPVYPREIIRRALELSSSSVILVHNHPTRPQMITLNHVHAY